MQPNYKEEKKLAYKSQNQTYDMKKKKKHTNSRQHLIDAC